MVLTSLFIARVNAWFQQVCLHTYCMESRCLTYPGADNLIEGDRDSIIIYTWVRMDSHVPTNLIKFSADLNRQIKMAQQENATLYWWWGDRESSHWRHNGRDGVSNHRPHHCLLNRLSGADQIKHQSSASLAFVRQFTGDKWSATLKMFPFDDVIMVTMNFRPCYDIAVVMAGKHCVFLLFMNFQIFHPKREWTLPDQAIYSVCLEFMTCTV